MSLPRPGLAIVANKPFPDGTLPFPDGLPEELKDWKFLEVSGMAGMYMAANCLPINPDVIIMATNSLAPESIQKEIGQLQQKVRDEGLKVHAVDMGHHGFNGGALRCATHPIRRNGDGNARLNKTNLRSKVKHVLKQSREKQIHEH